MVTLVFSRKFFINYFITKDMQNLVLYTIIVYSNTIKNNNFLVIQRISLHKYIYNLFLNFILKLILLNYTLFSYFVSPVAGGVLSSTAEGVLSPVSGVFYLLLLQKESYSECLILLLI